MSVTNIILIFAYAIGGLLAIGAMAVVASGIFFILLAGTYDLIDLIGYMRRTRRAKK